jgi:hypothetical protein
LRLAKELEPNGKLFANHKPLIFHGALMGVGSFFGQRFKHQACELLIHKHNKPFQMKFND